MTMKLTSGISCVLALGLAACSGSSGDNVDAYTPPVQPDGGIPAIDTATPAIDTAPAIQYTWVVIQDTEQKACSTNGPGADIDAVALLDATTYATIGWGKVGTATFTANPAGNACDNIDCNGGNCKYAAISKTFLEADLVSWTEGPNDAMVQAVGDDFGYFSLNGGTLQTQIGNALAGTGPAQAVQAGQFIRVFEVDKTYITSGDAPANCVCLPEHYTVTLQAQTGQILALKPVTLAAENTTCAAPTAASTEGCGTTVFMVP